jgi:hypothetical protein
MIGISPITGEWLVPAFDINVKINQLYKYVSIQGHNRLLATPPMGHKLWGLHLFDSKKPVIFICEGIWDGMALWELLGKVKQSNGSLVPTSNTSKSLLAEANVVAVPGAKTFFEDWATLFAGKTVNLMYDSDIPHKIEGTNKVSEVGGFVGMQRVARLLSVAKEPPSQINYLCWGKDGYNPSLPSGFDVRDALQTGMVL